MEFFDMIRSQYGSIEKCEKTGRCAESENEKDSAVGLIFQDDHPYYSPYAN